MLPSSCAVPWLWSPHSGASPRHDFSNLVGPRPGLFSPAPSGPSHPPPAVCRIPYVICHLPLFFFCLPLYSARLRHRPVRSVGLRPGQVASAPSGLCQPTSAIRRLESVRVYPGVGVCGAAPLPAADEPKSQPGKSPPETSPYLELFANTSAAWAFICLLTSRGASP